MKKGIDYPGIGVGAMIFDAQGRLLLTRRAGTSRNQHGTWEAPGGGVRFGETRVAAVVREVREELGVVVVSTRELLSFDDFPDGQHWVVTPFVVGIEGRPRIMEPRKCDGLDWFPLNHLPRNLSTATITNLRIYRASRNKR